VSVMQDDCKENGCRTFLRNTRKNFIPRVIRIQKTAICVCKLLSYVNKLSCSFSFSFSSIQC
jgi:hypothetical protein